MNKPLGYSITGLLSLAFVFCVLMTLYLTLVKPIWHLSSFQQAPATIVSCSAKNFSRGGTRYAPVAQTEVGALITGQVFWGSKTGCENKIGERVSVLINPNNQNEGDILTISQFWFFPTVLASLLTLIRIGVSFNQHRKKM